MASTEVEYKPAKGNGPPASQSKWQSFKSGLWDPQAKTLLGRTGASWAKITIFYLIYYCCLAAFFAAMWAIFFTTIPEDHPKQTDLDSLIKGNPGMGFRPMPDVEMTLIRFHTGDLESYQDLLDNTNDFIFRYKSSTDPDKVIDCSGDLPPKDERADKACAVDCTNGVPDNIGDKPCVVDCTGGVPDDIGNKACKFDMSLLGDHCTEEKHFGFWDGQPCILLKLNKVFGWMPQVYTNETVPEIVADVYTSDAVPLTCEGENNGDIDNMGRVEFYPPQGFPLTYFPFKAQKAYQTPIVFARFPNPEYGVGMQIWCKAWAENIYHHKNDKAGSVHFELLIN